MCSRANTVILEVTRMSRHMGRRHRKCDTNTGTSAKTLMIKKKNTGPRAKNVQHERTVSNLPREIFRIPLISSQRSSSFEGVYGSGADGGQSADVRSGVSSLPYRCLSADFSLLGEKLKSRKFPKRRAAQAKRDVKAAVLL